MNSKTKNNIVKLNTKFYSVIQKSFNENRQNRNWRGVSKALDKINDTKMPVIIDIGCGNCRLTKILYKKFSKNYIYYPIDNNNYFLDKCSKICKRQEVKFKPINIDLFNKLNWDIPKGDIIFALGVTHHIPSREYRNKWFINLSRYLKNGGYLFVSFWDTSKKSKSEIPSLGIYKKDLEPGDMFFGWSDKNNVYRYYHKYSESELQSLVKNYKSLGINLVYKYELKEFKNNSNKYFLFKKEL